MSVDKIDDKLMSLSVKWRTEHCERAAALSLQLRGAFDSFFFSTNPAAHSHTTEGAVATFDDAFTNEKKIRSIAGCR